MAAERDEIIAFCDELLGAEAFADYGPNGLQVPGARAVEKVATGVSAHLELLERAVAAGAGMLLVHHGLFWEGQSRALTDAMARRLRVAFEGDLSVAAYHLPLDEHAEVGNNALVREALGFAPSPERFGEAKDRPIGVVGRSEAGVAWAELVERVRSLTDRDPLVFDSGPEEVRSIGVVTGGGGRMFRQAIELGVDAYLTGEPEEFSMAEAREAGVHFIAAGHYATETFGVRRLGELVAERFSVEHEFVAVPNPV